MLPRSATRSAQFLRWRSTAWPGVCVLFASLLFPATTAQPQHLRPLLSAPIWVYNDWSAYDELSDEVPLNEALAMRELDEILRLGKAGVHFDYYMMDAFWYDPDGGYRTWRRSDWPDGPDRWIAACDIGLELHH